MAPGLIVTLTLLTAIVPGKRLTKPSRTVTFLASDSSDATDVDMLHSGASGLLFTQMGDQIFPVVLLDEVLFHAVGAIVGVLQRLGSGEFRQIPADAVSVATVGRIPEHTLARMQAQHFEERCVVVRNALQ